MTTNPRPKPRLTIDLSNDLELLINDLSGGIGRSKADVVRHAINLIRRFEPNARFSPNERLNAGVEDAILHEERENLGERLFEIDNNVARSPSVTCTEARLRRNVFISYAREDIAVAKKLFRKLKARGHRPWLDEFSLAKGADWKLEIEKAISKSEFFLAVISKNSVSKIGFVQVEVHVASQEQMRRPDGAIYFIPFKIDDANVPVKIAKFNYIDQRNTRRPYAELFDTIEKGSH